MQTEGLIAVSEFCASHQLEISFIHSLQDFGLIETTTVEQSTFINDRELPKLEQIARLHNLDINVEGIETITHLLQQMDEMHQEIIRLRNKLDFSHNINIE
ncbi:MAG: MerR family transcriptional regulator [Bacteroidetes bacterium]|nr:MerR family transcriptional regulator [Bacteroidota bacterium]